MASRDFERPRTAGRRYSDEYEVDDDVNDYANFDDYNDHYEDYDDIYGGGGVCAGIDYPDSDSNAVGDDGFFDGFSYG